MAELRIYNVPEEVKISLKVIAVETGSTLNETAIRAFKEWIAQQKKR